MISQGSPVLLNILPQPHFRHPGKWPVCAFWKCDCPLYTHHLWWPQFVLSHSDVKKKSQSSPILRLSLPPTRPYVSPESQTTSSEGRKKMLYRWGWLPGLGWFRQLLASIPCFPNTICFQDSRAISGPRGGSGLKSTELPLFSGPLHSGVVRPLCPDSVFGLTGLSHVLGTGKVSCPLLAQCCFLSFLTLPRRWATHDSIRFYPGGFGKWKTTEDAEWPHLKRTVLLIGHKDRNSECGPKPYLCRAHEST